MKADYTVYCRTETGSNNSSVEQGRISGLTASDAIRQAHQWCEEYSDYAGTWCAISTEIDPDEALEDVAYFEPGKDVELVGPAADVILRSGDDETKLAEAIQQAIAKARGEQQE